MTEIIFTKIVNGCIILVLSAWKQLMKYNKYNVISITQILKSNKYSKNENRQH